MPYEPDPSRSCPVFGPAIAGAESTHPLGKKMQLRINLEGCRYVPWYGIPSEGSHTRRKYYVSIAAYLRGVEANRAESALVQEGGRALRDTVQWDEILYLEARERSYIELKVHSPYEYPYKTFLSVSDFLTNSEFCLYSEHTSALTICTLYLSASKALRDSDGREHTAYLEPNVKERHDFHTGPRAIAYGATLGHTLMNSLHTVVCQLPSLVETLRKLKIRECHASDRTVGRTVYQPHHVLERMFIVYQNCLLLQRGRYPPRIDLLITTMLKTLSAILPLPHTYVQKKAKYILDISYHVWHSTLIVEDLVSGRPSVYESEHPDAELARLTWIIVTPGVAFGANSTSANLNRHTISKKITKDALLFALEAIVQSSDAFPPLKSAASGLLFFATSADMASSNKKQIRDIYKRVDVLVASLKSGAAEGGLVTRAHQEAIQNLADEIAEMNEDLEDIVTERKNFFKRLLSAKRHREKLQEIVWQFDNMRSNYTAAMATLNGTMIAQVLSHVQGMSLAMNANPMPLLGSCFADAVTFPSGSKVEEVQGA